jgi:defect-in-organelle-trafficking protein DotC
MKKNNSLTILMLLTFSLGVHAEITATKSASESVNYLGLDYPKPQVNSVNDYTPAELNQLMSSKLKDLPSDIGDPSVNVDKSAKKTDGNTEADKKTADDAATAQKNADNVNQMRRQAIVDIASSLGASAGLSYRMNQIMIDVNKSASKLDHLFDFSRVIIDNGVLAPVLTEGLSNYAQDSDDQVRIADKIYKIESPAKFVSVYPTWRSYLVFSFPTYELPPPSFLPRNDTEKAVWDSAVKEGWQKGIMQANNIFENSYNRMERDYSGMIKYKILLAEGLITPTIIAKQNFGVTGGGKEMSINDQVFRITDHSALNPNQEKWKVEYPITNNVNGVLK